MNSKLKLPFPVGYAKQITFPWEDGLSNSCGVEVVDGCACSRYDVVPVDDYQRDGESLQCVWETEEGLLEWSTDGYLLLRSPNTYDAVCNESFNYVNVVQTSKGLLILTDLGVYSLQKGKERATKTTLPPFTKAMVHNGRCFAVTGTDCKVYFSAFQDEFCFDTTQDGGWISFGERGGKAVALCVVGGNLYVFRQHSVERVTATAQQINFAVETIDFACGKLYANTLASKGKSAIFLTDWGLWSFDGKVFSRLAKHLDRAFAAINDYATAIWCAQGYLLNCKLSFDGQSNGGANNALVVAAGSSVVVLRGWDFCGLSQTLAGQPLLNSNGDFYTLADSDQTQTLRQCQLQTNFNSHKGKTVQFVTLATQTPVTLTVYFNNTFKVFNLQASGEMQSVFVNATGKSFRFVFKASGKMHLSPITVDYLLYKGGVAP